jgi:hypothetical protein
MMYNVIRPFKDINGSFLRPGDMIECDYNRAAILKRNGLISGQVAVSNKPSIPEVKTVETSEKKYVKRQYGKKAK